MSKPIYAPKPPQTRINQPMVSSCMTFKAISEKEVNKILSRIEEGADKPKPKVLFEPGEVIRVINGPFSEFNGVVEEVNYDKNRLRVAVMIFSRSTPVDLDFSQVEKN
jgi:transcriptional antiterminator NusG